MRIASEIEQKLMIRFAPSVLQVIDESAAHEGHGGWRPGGETHFRIIIRAAGFAPMTRVERHRAVHQALGPALTGRIHALALEISAD